MWNAINSKNNDIISLDMILINEQNNAIHAIIRNNIAEKFKPLLQEGKLPVGNDFKIMFTVKTSIKNIEETDVDILRHKFEFVDYNKIHEHVNKHVQLSDIIANVIGVGPIEQPCIKGSNVSMRNINVMTIEYVFLKKIYIF
ncbi:hypothetical protein ACB092_04G111900 [Castanea dentata]